MPRKPRIPTYRLHKSSGQAIVTLTCRLSGRRCDVLLGEHGTQASKKLYAKVIADWVAAGHVVDHKDARSPATTPGAETVARLLLDFWGDEKTRHGVASETELTGNLYTVRAALRICRSVCGREHVADFGPAMLLMVRERMIELGHGRHTVNRGVKNIVRAFKWGVEHERVSAQQIVALNCVRNLGRGERGVPEERKVHPVDRASVEAIQPHVTPQVWALVELGWLTGARMGELVTMRAVDIEAGGEVWLYRPRRHKTLHRGHERTIDLGPRAQAIVKPYLAREVMAPLFNPAEGLAARKADAATKGQHRRPNQKPNERRTDRRVGDAYSVDAVRRAIARACDAAFPPPEGLSEEQRKAWRAEHRWHPHQLRHAHATAVRKLAGIEAARVRLGHRTANVTQEYAEQDRELGRKVALEIG